MNEVKEWLSESAAAKILGFSRGDIIRNLPIPRFDFTKPNSKVKLYRYKHADVISFMQSRVSA